MMKERKMIWELAMYEFKNTPVSKYVWTLIVTLGAAYFGSELLDVIVPVTTKLPVLVDFLFLIILSLPISMIRYKPFTMQNVKGQLYVSSFFLLLKQTPISENVIRKSRFLITGLYTVVFNSLLFIVGYMLSESLQEILSVSQMIFLGICWLAISYIWGGLLAAAEPGGTYSQLSLVIWSIIFLFVFIGSLTLFNLLVGTPIVTWSIDMAQTHPFLLLLISVGIIVVSTFIWNLEYKRYAKKVDYLL